MSEAIDEQLAALTKRVEDLMQEHRPTVAQVGPLLVAMEKRHRADERTKVLAEVEAALVDMYGRLSPGQESIFAKLRGAR